MKMAMRRRVPFLPFALASLIVASAAHAAAPVITGLGPASIGAGTDSGFDSSTDGTFGLDVVGSGFVPGSSIQWNNSPFTSTLSCSSCLDARIPVSLAANPGTASITVKNPDGSTSNALTFTITDLRIGSSLPAGQVGVPYSQTVQVTGGTPPYSIGILSGFGSFPGDLTWNNGVITGTPVVAGTYSFRVTAQDVTTFASRNMTLTINPPSPTLTSINPNGAAAGSNVNVTVAGTNLTGASGMIYLSPGLAQSNFQVVNPTQITATFTILASATPGPVSMTVQTPGGTSNPVTFTITPPTCTLSVSPTSAQAVVSGGGSTQFTITASPSGCTGGAWTASVSTPSWMSVSPVSGTGSGSVTANYLANGTPSPRSGTVAIAGQNVTINQVAAPPSTCTFSASPTSLQNVAATGGFTSFTVTASPSGCSSGSWTASVSDPTWMSILPTSGTGSTPVTATYLANVGTGGRTGTVTIAGASVTINQAGAAVPSCTFSATPSSAQTVPGSGGTTVFTVVASPGGCSGGSWTASVSDPSWMSLSSTGGTAAGFVTATYLANASSNGRSGTVSIAGQNVTITQGGKVSSPPSVAPGTLPSGVVGTSYSANLSASGGTPPYSNWAFSGSFPPGLNLNASTGAISGSPSTAGGSPFAFNVTVKDSLGAISAPQSFSISVSPPQTVTITTSSIPGGLANVVYAATSFTVKGGTVPYQWSSTGALPGTMNFSSGGVLSGTPSAPGSFPFNVSVKDSSTPPLTASENFTLSVTQPGTLLSVTTQQLNFSYVQGDSNAPASQNIGVLSNPTGTPITASSSTSDGGTWLTAATSFSGGSKTPGTIIVSVDPTKLGPSTYSGQVTINASSASPSSVTVNISLVVGASQAPQLSVTPAYQSFALPQGGKAQGSLAISNTGGGVLGYSGTVAPGASWLSLTGSFAGNITPSTPGSIPFTVTVSPNMNPGLYQGTISVFDLGSAKTINSVVALLVSGSQPSMQLSQDGMTFYTVASANVATPPQSLAIFNLGSGTLPWTTQVQWSDPSHQGWMTVTPSGSSSSGTPGFASISVNAAGLPKGQYYATVNVVSAAANSPQTMSVLLNVVLPGELGSVPVVSTSGLILGVATGSSIPVTQSVTLFSPAGANPSYSTSVFTSEGGNWLTVPSPTGALSGGSATLTIQASAAALSQGVHFGTVQVAFSEGTVRTIQVILVASAGFSANATMGLKGTVRDASCTATTLSGVFKSPGSGDTLKSGQAQIFQVQITDDCGKPLLPSESPTAVLKNADTGVNVLPLTSPNSDGIWTGSWTPPDGLSTVSLWIFATRGKTFGGISIPYNATQFSLLPMVSLIVLPADATSAPQPVAAINGASFDVSNPGLVVPGGYVSIYGDRMADNTAQSGASLALTLGNSQLLLGGKPLPLRYADTGQVNGLIPQTVPLNSHIQLLVQRDNTVSVPVSVYVTDLQPGIFTTAGNGLGQGSILIHGTSLVAGPAGPQQQPVSRGQYIEIYATGLGQVFEPQGSAPPGDGQPAPAVSPIFSTKATATVTIGGINAAVVFAGLAPGFVALYQVNVLVPSNAPVGSTIPLILTMTDSNGSSASSQKVTLAVQ